MLAEKQFKDALRHCASEAIAHLGLVQPHGGLVILRDDGIVCAASPGMSRILGDKTKCLLQRQVADLVDVELLSGLEGLVAVNRQPMAALTWERYADGGQLFAISAYECAPYRILEFQPGAGTDRHDRTWLEKIGALSSRADDCVDLVELCQVVAATIRDETGFDRVKIYRFTPEYDGEVIAEAKDPDLESYLGLRFPEGDIPKQARELYFQHTIRAIVDTEAQPESILTVDELNPREIDLGPSALRS
ncbi:MAG: hypothetical protein AAFY56_19785, partial [Pseudomonadota bacterium]